MWWRLEMRRPTTFKACRVRASVQLRRYGANVAKWGNQLLHSLQFQGFGRGKKTTLHNLYVITGSRPVERMAPIEPGGFGNLYLTQRNLLRTVRQD